MRESVAPDVGGVSVSRETFARLEAFEALVRRWNPAINLVSKASLPELWSRHIADSAQLFQFCPPDAKHWADFGSGGGFPGIVVAVLSRESRPELRVTLVESDLRKATFLRQAVQALSLSASVHSDRIESLPPLAADVLSARALAPLGELLQHAHRHLRPEGTAVFPKGQRYREEIAEARRQWEFEVDARPSLSEPDAAILVIRKVDLARQN
jgi:16S rRNA (guanine527-N7)-methyltransferase